MNIAVTAGASGIGLAMAEAFITNGDNVAICDVDQQAIQRFNDKHPDAFGLLSLIHI